jgi:hypothetical protein
MSIRMSRKATKSEALSVIVSSYSSFSFSSGSTGGSAGLGVLSLALLA